MAINGRPGQSFEAPSVRKFSCCSGLLPAPAPVGPRLGGGGGGLHWTGCNEWRWRGARGEGVSLAARCAMHAGLSAFSARAARGGRQGGQQGGGGVGGGGVCWPTLMTRHLHTTSLKFSRERSCGQKEEAALSRACKNCL